MWLLSPLPHVHLSLSIFSPLPILQAVAATRGPEMTRGAGGSPASDPPLSYFLWLLVVVGTHAPGSLRPLHQLLFFGGVTEQ